MTESVNQFSETPSELELFSNDSFGNCEITLIPRGSFYELTSIGKFRKQQRKVISTLGGRIPALPDTVLILYNNLPWEGAEPNGTRVMRRASNTSKTSDLLQSILSDYEMMLQVLDTALLNPPITISSTTELDNITDTINGPLLIDGNYMSISWNEPRTIIILGDLQITGEVTIENVSFVVAGEIKLFDKTVLTKSSLFSKNRIFIGNYAQFEGDAMALHSITVFNDASVINKSTLVTAGQTADTSSDSSSARKTENRIKYSIFIEDNALVDAVCIALGTPGAIRTGTETTIQGVLWAQNAVYHQGTMSGLIRAGKMINSSDLPLSDTTGTPRNRKRNRRKRKVLPKNAMNGSLTQLSTLREYRMPCFTEELSIIGWKEE